MDRKKILLFLLLLGFLFPSLIVKAENNNDKTRRYLEAFANIDRVFSYENENIISNLEKIPSEYKNFISDEMNKYNKDLEFVIETIEKGIAIDDVEDVFFKYKNLRKFSNLLVSYDNLSKAVEANYKIINTANIYAKERGVDAYKELSDSIFELDNLVENMEYSLFSVKGLSFNNSKQTSNILKNIQIEYKSLKNSYKNITQNIIFDVERILAINN